MRGKDVYRRRRALVRRGPLKVLAFDAESNETVRLRTTTGEDIAHRLPYTPKRFARFRRHLADGTPAFVEMFDRSNKTGLFLAECGRIRRRIEYVQFIQPGRSARRADVRKSLTPDPGRP